MDLDTGPTLLITQSQESRLAQLEERTRVIRDSAVHGEALVETKREGYGGLAGEAYCRRDANEGARAEWWRNDCIVGRVHSSC